MNKVIVALDYPDLKSASKLISLFSEPTWFKIGLELFTRDGIEAVKFLKKFKHYCFLDLKLHDIPNTVYSTVKNLLSFKVDMIDVHASGGSKMLDAASRALEESKFKTKLIGVTVLTSLDGKTVKEELLLSKPLSDISLEYAKLCKNANFSGVVCSAHEAKTIKNNFSLITVCPGIRFEQNLSDDQKRFCTPKAAKQLGADYIVVGRPIIKSNDPYKAYLKICKEFKGV